MGREKGKRGGRTKFNLPVPKFFKLIIIVLLKASNYSICPFVIINY